VSKYSCRDAVQDGGRTEYLAERLARGPREITPVFPNILDDSGFVFYRLWRRQLGFLISNHLHHRGHRIRTLRHWACLAEQRRKQSARLRQRGLHILRSRRQWSLVQGHGSDPAFKPVASLRSLKQQRSRPRECLKRSGFLHYEPRQQLRRHSPDCYWFGDLDASVVPGI
jgi:hypothetical protein